MRTYLYISIDFNLPFLFVLETTITTTPNFNLGSFDELTWLVECDEFIFHDIEITYSTFKNKNAIIYTKV